MCEDINEWKDIDGDGCQSYISCVNGEYYYPKKDYNKYS